MLSQGFSTVINSAWAMINTTVIPANSFGVHGAVTLFHFLVMGVGGKILISFLRYCMGGDHFNISRYKEGRHENR